VEGVHKETVTLMGPVAYQNTAVLSKHELVQIMNSLVKHILQLYQKLLCNMCDIMSLVYSVVKLAERTILSLLNPL
jgi:hypothetical protein